MVSKFVIPGPDGDPARIGGVAFDITQRIQAEEALRTSEQRLRATFDYAGVGIVEVKKSGRDYQEGQQGAANYVSGRSGSPIRLNCPLKCGRPLLGEFFLRNARAMGVSVEHN